MSRHPEPSLAGELDGLAREIERLALISARPGQLAELEWVATRVRSVADRVHALQEDPPQMSQAYSTVTHYYEKISWPVARREKCPVCKQRIRRNTTFSMTLSPFNKDPETGKARTRQQILDALKKMAEEWKPDFRHGSCKDVNPDAP